MLHQTRFDKIQVARDTGSEGMAAYDTLAMATATPNDILRLSSQNGHMVPMDVFDQDLNFGEGDSILYADHSIMYSLHRNPSIANLDWEEFSADCFTADEIEMT
jgi:hypothetical protein